VRDLRKRASGVSVLGPAPAPLAVIRKRFRFQAVIKGPASEAVQAALDVVEPHLYAGRGSVRIDADVDPQSML
jgi:primosomal protein N' (replication factor Y)